MAWVRQLDSGLWAATAYTPAGRITVTDKLITVVQRWANDLEVDVRRQDFVDPRKSRTTIGEVWETYGHTRRLEMASRKRDNSQWKTHVEPRWGKVQVGTVLKPDVAGWVTDMEDALGPAGGWTITGSLNVLKAVLELAVDAGMIRSNPARRVRPPIPPKHVDRVIEPDERDVILARLDELFPDRRDARPFVELLLDTGGRWEEAAAVRREWVDLRRGVVKYGPAMERDGTIREYPKGARDVHSAGFRSVPMGDDLIALMRPLVQATKPGEVVFTASLGGVMRYPTWLRRVWNGALRVPEVDATGKLVRGEWTPLVAEPLPTPHDCRHTYGTELADAGVEPHDIMALMGHDDLRSSKRYIHSDEDKRFARAREARKRARS